MNYNHSENNKKEDFIENFENFYQVYNKSNLTDIELNSCANSARITAEAYCRYIILSSNKTGEEKKGLLYKSISKEEKHTLGGLKDNIFKGGLSSMKLKKIEQKHLKTELELILHKGNNGSHDRDYSTTLRDLEKLKPILIDLVYQVLGERSASLLIRDIDGKIETEVENKINKNESVINQESSGSGDNIARDKIVN